MAENLVEDSMALSREWPGFMGGGLQKGGAGPSPA